MSIEAHFKGEIHEPNWHAKHFLTPQGTWGNDIFGVPGDFAYPILDGILDDEDIQWRGSCNELNVGYSADGCTSPKIN